MKIFNIGKQQIYQDDSSVGLIETGVPEIEYPLNFTTKYFNITQEFYCASDSIPTFVQGIAHSKYPNSKSISQTSAKIVTTGIVSFKRKYVEFPSTTIEQPSTASISYPSIAVGVNYEGRGIDTVQEAYQVPSNVIDQDGNVQMITNFRDVPAVTNWYRKNSVTKVIPVITRISFIYMGDAVENKYISSSSVSVGTRINGKIVSQVSYDSQNQNYIYTFEDGSVAYGGRTTSIQVEVPVYNPSSILIDEPFKIIDNYTGHSGAEVEFIDDFTVPNRQTFLSQKSEDKLLFTSQVDHIEGYLYMKKNIYGKIQ